MYLFMFVFVVLNALYSQCLYGVCFQIMALCLSHCVISSGISSQHQVSFYP